MEPLNEFKKFAHLLKFNSEQENLLSDAQDLSECELEINKICEKQKINIESSISECGAGQFELSLKNDEDIIKIADNIVYLKYLIKGIAKKHVAWTALRR